MKTTTLPKLYRALRDDVYPVTVVRRSPAAPAGVDRMLSSV